MIEALRPHLLSWVVFLPFFTAFGLLAFRIVATAVFSSDGLPGWIWRGIALASSLLTLLLAGMVLWSGFDPEVVGYQWVERMRWIPELGVHYFVGVDGISLVLVMLTTFVIPIALLSSWKEVEHSLESYVVLLLCLETGVNGALVSLNWIQLYFFWELTLISSFFLMGRWGGHARLRAAFKYLIVGLSSSLLMLIATLVVHRLNFEQSGMANFDLVTLGNLPGLAFLDTVVPLAGSTGAAWWQTQDVLFAAFALALAVKLPLFPFHVWYNDAQCKSPTAGSVIVSALVLKLGAFAFLRVALPLFPDAATESASFMSRVAVFGVVAGGLLCLAQRDVKRMVGFWSLAHISFIAFGIFSLQHHAVVGSVVHMLSHGLSITALFILFGFLSERRATREVDAFGGLAKPMPLCAGLFALVVLGQVGIPGTSGFVSAFLVVLGSFPTSAALTAVAVVGLLLVGGATLVATGRVLLGTHEQPENRGLIDFNLRERAVVITLVIATLWVGIHPNPVLRRVEPSVSRLLFLMEQSRQVQSKSGAQAAGGSRSSTQAQGGALR